jgi:hypothetical protein
MNRKELKKRVRAAALEEARLDDRIEVEVERTLRKWKYATVIAGGAMLAGIISVIPFLAGQPFHDKWEVIGKRILLITMCLNVPFVYTAGHTLVFWNYLRRMRKIHKKYAPPGSKYRAGKGA